MSQTTTPMEKLIAEAIDADAGLLLSDWCEKRGLDTDDIARVADAYHARSVARLIDEGAGPGVTSIICVREVFVYGLMLGRHLDVVGGR